ncbi:uncharacterized protein LOC143026723 [Oratosquilla oratoria]|uniref:uncharacterized protein LOC143026723 n=1 Tax=Oratosquilla oratoria TaxID=337810 RepID=UPI003F7708C3
MQARREKELREIEDNKNIVEVLQRFLLANNKTIGALLAEFESAKELMETYMKQQEVIPEVAITLKSAEGVNTKEHKGVYNLPTAKAQASIRRERCDILKADVASAKERGQRIIIPPTFVGGPRYMKQRQQDALAVKSFLYSTEWQKRGLPHVHILLWMEYRVTAEFVDEIICAEIPDKEKEPRLRRAPGEGGFTFERKIKGKNITVDNSWVVPYNPYLCLKYNAHINVECSNSIKCIAYVTKYVNKGCDKILYTKHKEGEPVNEVRNYLEARYINANEATWKIFKFPIHRSFPPITSLDLHLENENEIYYRETDLEHKISEQANQDTQLTAFFKLCKTNEFAKTLYYPEVPSHFVYDEDKHTWDERMTKTSSLGRMRAVDTKTVELFYLRMLLTHKKGPTGYTDLRTVDGVLYDTFREAVKAMGLLNDEETWKKTIIEIINHTNDRSQLRATYASMLVFSDLEDQSDIWKETRDLFASDFLRSSGLDEYNDEIYLDALDDIQQQVWNCGGGEIRAYGLPPSRGKEKTSSVIRREKAYNTDRLKEEVSGNIVLLNKEQRAIYDAVMECVNNRRSGGFFLNAPGGKGKSFVLNLLLDTVRANSEIALAVASSGIAATVLHGGRTAHSMFKIPIMEHNEVKPCSIKLNSELARLIKMTSLIVWDEVVMTNKNKITALDCTAKDITGNKHCFMGGIPFVCAGDFRQILPVIRGGGKNEELKYNIKNAIFWEDLRKFKLVQNVRLKAEDKENRTFAENLLA